jgi:hypothetical protein
MDDAAHRQTQKAALILGLRRPRSEAGNADSACLPAGRGRLLQPDREATSGLSQRRTRTIPLVSNSQEKWIISVFKKPLSSVP